MDLVSDRQLKVDASEVVILSIGSWYRKSWIWSCHSSSTVVLRWDRAVYSGRSLYLRRKVVAKCPPHGDSGIAKSMLNQHDPRSL